MPALEIAKLSILPQVGGFYGYKKVADNIVLKLYISKKGQRLNSFGSRKCRADKVKVVEALNADGTKSDKLIHYNKTHDKKLAYEVGKWVSVDDFNSSLTEECAAGIHFFLTYEEAKAW